MGRLNQLMAVQMDCKGMRLVSPSRLRSRSRSRRRSWSRSKFYRSTMSNSTWRESRSSTRRSSIASVRSPNRFFDMYGRMSYSSNRRRKSISPREGSGRQSSPKDAGYRIYRIK